MEKTLDDYTNEELENMSKDKFDELYNIQNHVTHNIKFIYDKCSGELVDVTIPEIFLNNNDLLISDILNDIAGRLDSLRQEHFNKAFDHYTTDEEVKEPEYNHKGIKTWTTVDGKYDLVSMCYTIDGKLYGEEYPYISYRQMAQWITCPRCIELMIEDDILLRDNN